MEKIKIINKKAKEIFSGLKNKKAVFAIVLGVLGIILILLSEIVPKNEEKSEEPEKIFPENFSESETELEKRLEEAVSRINGAGKTDITITFDSSKEFIYAKNSTENIGNNETESESEFVIIEGKNGEEPLVLKTAEAKIRGVLVVCEGGENPLVREKILEAVCALLDIPSNKVSVAKMA